MMMLTNSKMRMPLHTSAKHTQKKQTGFSLIELMVSMAIGLVILGALIFTYLSGIKGNANAQAQAQVSEDAQVALNIIAQNIRQAGFVSGDVAGIDLTLGRGGFAFFACDTGFSNDTTAAVPGKASVATAAANMSAVNCAASSAANANGVAAGFAVAYEADTSNTKQSTGGFVSDCNGFGLGVASGIVVENRFFLQNGTLHCSGSQVAVAGAAPAYAQEQPLVNGVESMHIQFGLAGTGVTAGVADVNQVEGYATTTDQIGPATGSSVSGVISALHSGLRLYVPSLLPSTTIPAPTNPIITTNAARWRLVRTVRICIVGRNEEVLTRDLAVAGANPQYYDCNGTLTNITDGKMRKAYATTVFLRNLTR
jgi:type IV pilus assembly protein PilW